MICTNSSGGAPSENACFIQNSFQMEIKAYEDGMHWSRPGFSLRFQAGVMITHTHTHTKAQICTREARQMLPEPRLLSPRPTRCHLRSMFGPAPPPATPLPGPLATAPCPAPLRQLLTSSSGVRVSRSPQQQHHLQQQHRDPLHPAIFLLYCHPGPLWQPPPAQDPRLT